MLRKTIQRIGGSYVRQSPWCGVLGTRICCRTFGASLSTFARMSKGMEKEGEQHVGEAAWLKDLLDRGEYDDMDSFWRSNQTYHSDSTVGNVMLAKAHKTRNVHQALEVLRDMIKAKSADLVSFQLVLRMLVENGNKASAVEVFKLFCESPVSCKPEASAVCEELLRVQGNSLTLHTNVLGLMKEYAIPRSHLFYQRFLRLKYKEEGVKGVMECLKDCKRDLGTVESGMLESATGMLIENKSWDTIRALLYIYKTDSEEIKLRTLRLLPFRDALELVSDKDKHAAEVINGLLHSLKRDRLYSNSEKLEWAERLLSMSDNVEQVENLREVRQVLGYFCGSNGMSIRSAKNKFPAASDDGVIGGLRSVGEYEAVWDIWSDVRSGAVRLDTDGYAEFIRASVTPGTSGNVVPDVRLYNRVVHHMRDNKDIKQPSLECINALIEIQGCSPHSRFQSYMLFQGLMKGALWGLKPNIESFNIIFHIMGTMDPESYDQVSSFYSVLKSKYNLYPNSNTFNAMIMGLRNHVDFKLSSIAILSPDLPKSERKSGNHVIGRGIGRLTRILTEMKREGIQAEEPIIRNTFSVMKAFHHPHDSVYDIDTAAPAIVNILADCTGKKTMFNSIDTCNDLLDAYPMGPSFWKLFNYMSTNTDVTLRPNEKTHEIVVKKMVFAGEIENVVPFLKEQEKLYKIQKSLKLPVEFVSQSTLEFLLYCMIGEQRFDLIDGYRYWIEEEKLHSGLSVYSPLLIDGWDD